MGRGSSKVGGGSGMVAGGGNKDVFSPSKTDEVSEKLSKADTLKFSRTTVTMKNEDGKTIGMVRGIERFSDMSGAKQFSSYQEVKRVGLDNMSISSTGIKQSDIYFDGKQIYVFNNVRNSKYLSRMSPTLRKSMSDEIQRNNRKNQLLKNAEQNGAIIINYE